MCVLLSHIGKSLFVVLMLEEDLQTLKFLEFLSSLYAISTSTHMHTHTHIGSYTKSKGIPETHLLLLH